MTRVAAIDCGTNSIRLFIADVPGRNGAGTETNDVHREMRVVRLGQGVDKTGRFDSDALRRTLEAVSDYAQLCRTFGVEKVRFVATSATRDASNRDEFISGVHARLGVNPEVITGEEEAALSFAGAVRAAEGAQEPILVVDLGGGSTELVLGSRGKPTASWSMDVGCVRMTERHLETDPPADDEVDRAREDVRAALARAADEIPLGEARTVVGVAGSITTVTAHALNLTEYDPQRINGAHLSAAAVDKACEELLRLPRAGRAQLGFMHPGRVDVIGAGALVWQETVRAVLEATHGRTDPIITSEHDILDGIAMALAEA